MIMFLGYTTTFFLAIFVFWLVYEVIRGGVLGFDLMCWRLLGADWNKIKAYKHYRFQLVKLFVVCWKDCMFYRSGDMRFSSSGKKDWAGYGTWKREQD